jgi:type IV pilus assembly protein PilA
MSRPVNIGVILGGILVIVATVATILPVEQFAKVRKRTDDASAMASMVTIFQAELQYNSIYPDYGFSCSLESLGSGSNAGQPTPSAANLLPPDLASGRKAGYIFTLANCTQVTVKGKKMIIGYKLSAVPEKSGSRGFCTDESNKIMVDPKGGKNCTEPLD